MAPGMAYVQRLYGVWYSLSLLLLHSAHSWEHAVSNYLKNVASLIFEANDKMCGKISYGVLDYPFISSGSFLVNR